MPRVGDAALSRAPLQAPSRAVFLRAFAVSAFAYPPTVRVPVAPFLPASEGDALLALWPFAARTWPELVCAEIHSGQDRLPRGSRHVARSAAAPLPIHRNGRPEAGRP